MKKYASYEWNFIYGVALAWSASPFNRFISSFPLSEEKKILLAL